MNKEQRANVNIRIYQLERKIDQLKYDAKYAPTLGKSLSLLARARDIEFIIGY